MTDPQRPLTRREARELRRAQEAAAQQQSAPQQPATEQANATQPSGAEHRHGRRSAGPVDGPAAPSAASAAGVSSDAAVQRSHGRRRGGGPVDGGVRRIPKLAPSSSTPEVSEEVPPSPIPPVAEPAIVEPTVVAPPIVEPPIAEPPAPKSPVESQSAEDDETQLGLPTIVPGGRDEPAGVFEPIPAPSPLPPVPPRSTPKQQVTKPQAPKPQAAEREAPAVSSADDVTELRRSVQAALSSGEPRELQPEQIAELDHEREQVLRSALDRAHQQRIAESATGTSPAQPSFSELLGIQAPDSPSSSSKGSRRRAAKRSVEPKPLAPAVAPLNSPQQRQLENTGLMAPATSTIPVTFVGASKSAQEEAVAPLQARQAHGLDPLEYRVSGVKRTRAGLAVVIGSVVVAAAAVVLAINL